MELNIGSLDREVWKDMKELSTGQKATTILLLLLLESDAPLIIDQPEDDLDNFFIAEGIVPKMREEKRKRQFIFITIPFATLKAQNGMKPLPLSLFYFKTVLLRLQATTNHVEVSALLL